MANREQWVSAWKDFIEYLDDEALNGLWICASNGGDLFEPDDGEDAPGYQTEDNLAQGKTIDDLKKVNKEFQRLLALDEAEASQYEEDEDNG